MNIVSLCTGTGALDRAVQNVLGGKLAWYSEFDPKISRIMAHHHPELDNMGDLKTIEWSAQGGVDVLTAGYPCQPFSAAGKRKGANDERHLWPYIAEAIGVARPRLVVLENVRGHLSLGFKEVLADLARLGYDARWSVVRAFDVGACHQRARLFVVAYPCGGEPQRWRERGVVGGASVAQQGEGHQRERAGYAAGHGGAPSPYPQGERLDGTGSTRIGRERPAHGSEASPDSDGSGRTQQRWPSSVSEEQSSFERGDSVDWGEYEAGIRRWERVLGRPAPEPTEPGTRGNRRLSARFVEWMMGLPDGWVTDVPGLSRNDQIKACGNGVVQLQAEHALRGLLEAT